MDNYSKMCYYKIMMYTAITGRDKPREDIKCFSEYSEFNKPVLNAKIYKLLPWQFLDTDISIWMDGNLFPKVSEEFLISLLGDNDMALFTHPVRNTVHEEKNAIQYFYPKHWLMAENYWNRLVELGFKDDQGLAHCGIIIRRHNNKVKEFCNAWLSEILTQCTRDQMSFPYVKSLIKDIKIKIITEPKEQPDCFTQIHHLDQ